MKRKVLLSFAIFGLALASAKSYSVNIGQNAMAGDTQLKAGTFKLEVDGQKATVKQGKVEAQNPVRVETTGQKFAQTAVRYNNADGKMHIQEIQIGGTNTKILFTNTTTQP